MSWADSMTSVSMPLVLLLAVASVFSVPVSLAEETCIIRLPAERCLGDLDECIEKRVCRHGSCDQNYGCVCDPCWAGDSCNEYVDQFGPTFATREAFHKVSDTPEGLSYSLQVNDEDLGLTCPLGVSGPPARCPCSVVEYRLISSELGTDAVHLDPETGVVTITDRTKLDCSRRYRLHIEAHATPPVDADVRPRRDAMNLTLYCASDLDAELRRAMEEAASLEQAPSDALLLPPENALEELDRHKRDAAGANPEDTAMSLVRTMGVGVTSPKIGAVLSWEFTIQLPTITDMDMIVEAFVANLDSGRSVFKITDMSVTSFGSGVTSSIAAASTANAFTGVSGETFKNSFNSDVTDRAVIQLGSLSNTDTAGSGVADASNIKISLSAMVIHNPDVVPDPTETEKEYVTIGAEYSGSNYILISNDAFSPNSQATDIVTGMGTLTAVTAAVSVNQYSGGWAVVSLPVVAAMGTVQVEAHIAGVADEDALSIGGSWVELGADFAEPSGAFNGDEYRTNQVMSRSGGARRLSSFEFDFLQTGDSAASSADAGRAMTINIPVYATKNALVGSSGLLVVFVRVKDRLTGAFVDAGASVNMPVTVLAGTAPTAAGSMTLIDRSTVVSTGLDVPLRSVVEYNVVATVSTGDSYIASETLTLDTSAAAGLRACDVEVLALGTNILHIESATIAFTPENGDTSAVLTITGLRGTELTTNPKGYEVTFRVAVRADVSGAGTYTLGGTSFTLDSVNATGEPTGTQPTVTVAAAGGTAAYIGSQFGIELTVEYPVEDLASTGDADFQVEFVNDLRLSYEVRMCSVHVVYVGRDLPCARSKLTGDLPLTFSLSNTTRTNNDVVATTLPLTCATRRNSQEALHRSVVLRAVGEVVAGQTLSETAFNPGAGLVFDDSTLYAGLVSDMTLAAALTAYTSSAGDPTVSISSPGTLTYGKVHMVNVIVYVPPGAHSPMLSITATSSNPAAFRVDRIYLSRVGRNFGCLSTSNRLVNLDQLRETDPAAVPETYPAFSVDSDEVLGSSVTITLGPVSNVGPAASVGILNTVDTTNVMEGDNHIVLAVAVQGIIGADGVVPADGAFDLTVSGMKDSAGTIAATTGTITLSGSDTQYLATDGALSSTFTPRNGTTVYRGIPKVVDLVTTLPEGFYGTLKVQCLHGAADTTQWEVKGAAAVRHGQNVHGVWSAEAKATITPGTLGGMELSAQADLVLRDVTRLETVPTATTEDNQLRVACVALVPAVSDVGSSITMQAVLMDSADAAIGTPLEATLTVSSDSPPATDAASFNTNQTVDLSGNTVTPSASIGQYMWVPFRLIVPPGIHDSELAIVTATDTARAFYTVHGIRYGANMGADVLGAPLLTEELLNFTHTNRNLTHKSQFDSLLVSLGHITNLGLSSEIYRGKGSDAEWGMELEVQIQVTDHPQLRATSTATKPLYISFKLGDIIVVETQDVTATLAGSEKVDLQTNLTLKQPEKTQYDKEIDQKVGMSVMVSHSNTSTLEAIDARVVIIFPPYMNYTEGDVQTNASSITVLFKGSSVALVVGDIYFTDIFTVDFNASIDPNYVRGRGSGWANATTLARPICKPTLDTNAYARCGPMTYTMYEVSNPECFEPLLATLVDCKFSVSAAIERSTSYGPPAIKTTGLGWRPPVRDDPSWTSQYVEVRFGVPTRVSGWKVINDGIRKVTQVKLMASDDGLFFQEKYTGTVTEGMAMEALGDSSFRAKNVRIVIGAADADASSYIQIRAELYGCHTDTVADSTCPDITDNTIYSSEPYKWRHFAVDTTNSIIYYCDYDMAKDAMLCFASRDDVVWIGQPKYIGQLLGHSGGKMYARDSKLTSTLASNDGEHWETVAAADVPAALDDVMVVKGTTSSDSETVSQGDYQGDYFGIQKAGTYLVKWGKCCN